nr:MAG TPA: hypothetical protein [Caudoviricetes sp.]
MYLKIYLDITINICSLFIIFCPLFSSALY